MRTKLKILGICLCLFSVNSFAATVSDSLDQTVDGESFNFNLSSPDYIFGTSSLVTVTVQGDFNGEQNENISSIFIEGNNFGSFDIFSTESYNIIDYTAGVENFNAFEFSLDFFLDAATTALFLADDVLDININFGSGVTALCGWSGVSNCLSGEGNSPFASATLEYNTSVSTVPVPAAAWLFGSALLGFFGVSRRKKA